MNHRKLLSALAALTLHGCACDMDLGRDVVDAAVPDAGTFTPRTDACGNGIDDDRNGRIDDGCWCGTGETQSCFSGPYPGHRVGACRDGMQTCEVQEFGDWGLFACIGEVLPSAELCDGIDNDCDGAVDEDCPCPADTSRPCSDEFATAPCMPGTQTCRAGTWSRCEGVVAPSADVCTDAIDNDCDGIINNGCTCVSVPEVCRDGVDNDCDGDIDEVSCAPLPDAGMSMPDAGVDFDANIRPPTCDQLREPTGADWVVAASAISDGTGANGTGVIVEAKRVAVDASGNVYVLGQVCDGHADVAGFAVSSYAVVNYPRLTCNVFLVSLTASGALRYGWNPTLADEPVPPPMAAGPASNGSAIVPDGLGGVWVSGSFAGVLTLAPGRTFTETTRDGGDAFLVHIDATGVVRENFVVGESGTVEYFSDVTLAEGGDPIVVGSSSAPIFGFGSTLVRPERGVFVAQVAPTGEPVFVTTIRPVDATSGIAPGRLSVDPSGNIVLAGGSNGPVTFGTLPLASTDRTRGQAWLWTLSGRDGSTLGVRSWQASVGYYATLKRARVMDGFTGIAGTLRGEVNIDGAMLSAGMGRPEEPVSNFAVDFADGTATPVWARAFVSVPFDAFHGVDTHFDWNACHETMLVAEGLQGSSGPIPTPPVSQVDFGAGLVEVPQNSIQLVQWSPTGALQFRHQVSVASGFDTVVNDAAWSPVERSVVVALVHRTDFDGTLSVRRFGFR